MLLDSSRYAKVAVDEVRTRDGRTVVALRLRRLPAVTGEPHVVNDDEQLDVLAHEQYGDGTRFWHIADANTELQARELLVDTGRTIEVPHD